MQHRPSTVRWCPLTDCLDRLSPLGGGKLLQPGTARLQSVPRSSVWLLHDRNIKRGALSLAIGPSLGHCFRLSIETHAFHTMLVGVAEG